MATGALEANVGRLRDAMRAARCPHRLSPAQLRAADARALLPVLHFALLELSPHVAARAGALHGLDDARFAEAALRVAARELGLRPRMGALHLLSPGFAERRLIFAADLLRAALAAHEEGERAAALRRRGPVPPYAHHFSLAPAGASTHDGVRAQTGAAAAAAAAGERGAGAGENDLAPPRLRAYPAAAAGGRRALAGGGPRASSERVYAMGAPLGDAEGGAEDFDALAAGGGGGGGGGGYARARASARMRGGAATSGLGWGEAAARADEADGLRAAERFFSAAVALGQGADAALVAARRRAAAPPPPPPPPRAWAEA